MHLNLISFAFLAAVGLRRRLVGQVEDRRIRSSPELRPGVPGEHCADGRYFARHDRRCGHEGAKCVGHYASPMLHVFVEWDSTNLSTNVASHHASCIHVSIGFYKRTDAASKSSYQLQA